MRWRLLTVLLTLPVGADIPVHCPHSKLVGRWKFHVGSYEDNGHVNPRCGYDTPDNYRLHAHLTPPGTEMEKEDGKYYMTSRFRAEGVLLVLLDERRVTVESNSGVDFLPNGAAHGSYTSVSNEGMDLSFTDSHDSMHSLFAFHKHTLPDSDVDIADIAEITRVSHCGTTLLGWWKVFKSGSNHVFLHKCWWGERVSDIPELGGFVATGAGSSTDLIPLGSEHGMDFVYSKGRIVKMYGTGLWFIIRVGYTPVCAHRLWSNPFAFAKEAKNIGWPPLLLDMCYVFFAISFVAVMITLVCSCCHGGERAFDVLVAVLTLVIFWAILMYTTRPCYSRSWEIPFCVVNYPPPSSDGLHVLTFDHFHELFGHHRGATTECTKHASSITTGFGSTFNGNEQMHGENQQLYLVDGPRSQPLQSDDWKTLKQFDWRHVKRGLNGLEGFVPHNVEQHHGECYALATTSMHTSRLMVRYPELQRKFLSDHSRVSESMILRCDSYNQGIDGGYPYLVSRFASENDMVTSECARGGIRIDDSKQCSIADTTECSYRFRVINFHHIGGPFGRCGVWNQCADAMKEELYKGGPITGSVVTGASFTHFAGSDADIMVPLISPDDTKVIKLVPDVNTDADCMKITCYPWYRLDHSTLIIGWGEHVSDKICVWSPENVVGRPLPQRVDFANQEACRKLKSQSTCEANKSCSWGPLTFWTLQNTWGSTWGEKGFGKIGPIGSNPLNIEVGATSADLKMFRHNGPRRTHRKQTPLQPSD